MSDKEFTVSEVIDSFGLNAHTWRVFVLLACSMIFDGYDFMIVNSTNTYLAASFGVSGAAMGSLTTWGLLGMVIGGACGGILSDKIGRKKMLTLASKIHIMMKTMQLDMTDLKQSLIELLQFHFLSLHLLMLLVLLEILKRKVFATSW